VRIRLGCARPVISAIIPSSRSDMLACIQSQSGKQGQIKRRVWTNGPCTLVLTGRRRVMMPLVLIWLTAGFAGAAVLVVLLFWIAERYFRDD
jgi:hypothetical protein